MSVLGTIICQSCGKSQDVFLDSDGNPVRWSDVKQDYVPATLCIACRRIERVEGVNVPKLALSMVQYLRLHKGEITPAGLFTYWKRQGHKLYDNAHDNMKLLNLVGREVNRILEQEENDV